MAEEESVKTSWQATRVQAAAALHPVPAAIIQRLVVAMEGEMITKKLSAKAVDAMATELLHCLEETPE